MLKIILNWRSVVFVRKYRWHFLYAVFSIVWTLYYLDIGGGEEGMVPFLATSLVTFPIIIFVMPLGSFVHSDLLVPLMLDLNYFQWIILLKIYREWKA
jgi:hypothetical protein